MARPAGSNDARASDTAEDLSLSAIRDRLFLLKIIEDHNKTVQRLAPSGRAGNEAAEPR